MYFEETVADKCHVSLTCDRDCLQQVRVVADNHEDAQMQLYRMGWSLYRGKQLCPTHTRQVAKRLNRNAARALSV